MTESGFNSIMKSNISNMLPKHNKVVLKEAEKQGDVIDCSTFFIIWIWLSLGDVFIPFGIKGIKI